jgi:hypothetical protein
MLLVGRMPKKVVRTWKIMLAMNSKATLGKVSAHLTHNGLRLAFKDDLLVVWGHFRQVHGLREVILHPDSGAPPGILTAWRRRSVSEKKNCSTIRLPYFYCSMLRACMKDHAGSDK